LGAVPKFEHIEWVEADLSNPDRSWWPDWPVEAVLLDPPREGSRGLLAEIEGRGVAAIVYVSCDPATLGRDLSELGDGWRVDTLDFVDLFPKTKHIEAIVGLTQSA
jgi:23S rRNA (uracil1939-C5)-methyltransferase